MKFADAKSSARRRNNQRETPIHFKFFEEGGYAVLFNDSSKLIFRCPKRFKFRPAQCDLLHIDLWTDGINILRDAGTYSYNCPNPWQDYFKSNAAHNTIQFDDHDQMPQISRFLYGKWPQLDVRHGAEGEKPYIEAGFMDWKGCFHKRSITSTSSGFNVVDNIKGNFTTAVLRWRLSPELDWKLDGNICTSDRVSPINHQFCRKEIQSYRRLGITPLYGKKHPSRCWKPLSVPIAANSRLLSAFHKS